jgi:uncharacterized protein YndB with AHSA1/START domain
VIVDLSYEEYFAKPLEHVWRALTDRRMLGVWLMQSDDFEPVIGKRFTLRCPPDADWNGVVQVEVLELEPPRRMVWSWFDGVGGRGPSRVSFELRAEGAGTRLFLSHRGDSDDEQGARLRGGWPGKMEGLRAVLGSSAKP